jgi:hypothetical protein
MLSRCWPRRGGGRLARRLGQDRPPGAHVSEVSDRDPQAPKTPVRVDYGSLTEAAPGDGAQHFGAIPCLIHTPLGFLTGSDNRYSSSFAASEKRSPAPTVPLKGRDGLLLHRPDGARFRHERESIAMRTLSFLSGHVILAVETGPLPDRAALQSLWESRGASRLLARGDRLRLMTMQRSTEAGDTTWCAWGLSTVVEPEPDGVGLAWPKMQPLSPFTPLPRLGDGSRGDGSRPGR